MTHYYNNTTLLRRHRHSLLSQCESGGFTLVELIVALGVFTVAFVLVLLFVVQFIVVGGRVRATQSATHQAQAAIEYILLEIREGGALYTPTSVFDTDASQLSIVTTRTAPDDSEPQTYRDIYLDNTVLMLKEEGSAPWALTTDDVRVTQFHVTNTSTASRPAASIALTLEQSAPGAERQKVIRVWMQGTAATRLTE